MKNFIKRILPPVFIEKIRSMKRYRSLKRDTLAQMNRYYRNYNYDGSLGLAQSEVRTIFYAHQIEKGLSHKNFRYGFGHQALSNLAQALLNLRSQTSDPLSNVGYVSAIDALHEYIVKHREHGYDLGEVQKMFDHQVWLDAEQASGTTGGMQRMELRSKVNSESKTFKELSESRHSVREYADTPVDEHKLLRAVSMAMRTPTVCNRQPARVHIILDSSKIAESLHIQGGFNGYRTPPALLLITSDIRAFLNENERNEAFVDGGLYAMSLLLALEAVGLAACPLNTMMNQQQDSATRALLQIPDYEFMVMYIAVGNFAQVSNVCVSKRVDGKDIVTIIK